MSHSRPGPLGRATQSARLKSHSGMAQTLESARHSRRKLVLLLRATRQLRAQGQLPMATPSAAEATDHPLGVAEPVCHWLSFSLFPSTALWCSSSPHLEGQAFTRFAPPQPRLALSRFRGVPDASASGRTVRSDPRREWVGSRRCAGNAGASRCRSSPARKPGLRL